MKRFDPTLSRRRLLASGTVAALGLGFSPRFLVRSAGAQSVAKKVLVVVFQRGAVDGLNMVVPYNEPDYYAKRRSIAVPPPGQTGGGIDLDGEFALHPALGLLAPHFENGELAVVHACGSPDPTRSHFDAQDFMENGTPGDKTTEDGWLNRHLASSTAADDTIFRAVALQGTLPRSLLGPADAIATTSLDALSLGRGRGAPLVHEAIETMYGSRRDVIGMAVRNAIEAVDVAAGIPDLPPDNGAEYPAVGLGPALGEIARLIKADVGLEIACADVGGWDTHANQGASEGQLAGLLGGLAASLDAFRTDLGDRFGDVCVVTLSEFGRTVAENGTCGTDHGRGTAMLVLGGAVNGGRVYGEFPGLAEDVLFEGRDLPVTTDFRSLLAELVSGHLGNDDIASVFPGFIDDPKTRLGIV